MLGSNVQQYPTGGQVLDMVHEWWAEVGQQYPPVSNWWAAMSASVQLAGRCQARFMSGGQKSGGRWVGS